MAILKDVSPFLAPLPAKFGTNMIAFQAPEALLCIPLPPWSTLEDLDASSGLVVPDPDNVWISWDEQLPIDGYNNFRILPRNEQVENYRSVYAAGSGPFAEAGSRRKYTIETRRIGPRSCGVNLSDDPFGRPISFVQAFCEMPSPNGCALLEHTECFSAFDLQDEKAWPISRDSMLQRLERVMRLEVEPHP